MNSKIIDDSEGDRKIFRIQGGCGFPGFRGVFEMGGGGKDSGGLRPQSQAKAVL